MKVWQLYSFWRIFSLLLIYYLKILIIDHKSGLNLYYNEIRAICETVNSGIHPYHASRYYDWLISMGVNNIDKKDVSK